MNRQSLRHMAKELDISPAYLSYMVNGKRTWRKDLYQRYMGVVNTFVNNEAELVDKTDETPRLTAEPGTTWGCSSAGEHLLCMQGARGSIPLTSTTVFHAYFEGLWGGCAARGYVTMLIGD